MKKSVKKIVNDKEFLTKVLCDGTYYSSWGKFGVHTDTPKDVWETAKAVNGCREDIWADVLLNGGYFLIEDCEEGKDHKLSIKDFEKGFKKFIFGCPSSYASLMDGTYDYYDCDNLLQIVTFGEVIYG